MMAVAEHVVNVLKSSTVDERTRNDQPNYWRTDPRTLLTSANVHSICFGTGHQVYHNAILPAIEDAEEEVILVTCFWAQSSTLIDLSQSLRKLSAKANRNRRTIRVRICFSSSSLWQKLSQTSSLEGYTWPESKWRTHLGLPQSDELSGLDMTVKSVFQLPFSVIHPKFVVIDRRQILLPSCNVSWEAWLEGCIAMSGPVVQQAVKFWQQFWASGDDQGVLHLHETLQDANADAPHTTHKGGLLSSAQLHERDVSSTFLPSPHHRFSLPWLSSERSPPTPLNIYLLTVFARAERHIYVQTPNLTSSNALAELLAALSRGVDITILTSAKLMRLEQIVTAGTTTQRCVRWLIKQYDGARQRHHITATTDVEAGLMPHAPGKLVVRYYEPCSKSNRDQDEPVQSHLKLTIVDSKTAIFGSGNLDRASFHTSQELGVTINSERLVGEIERCLSVAMDRRSVLAYDSEKA